MLTKALLPLWTDGDSHLKVPEIGCSGSPVVAVTSTVLSCRPPDLCNGEASTGSALIATTAQILFGPGKPH